METTFSTDDVENLTAEVRRSERTSAENQRVWKAVNRALRFDSPLPTAVAELVVEAATQPEASHHWRRIALEVAQEKA